MFLIMFSDLLGFQHEREATDLRSLLTVVLNYNDSDSA